MNSEIINPVKDPYSAAQQTLVELIRAGKIENVIDCFDKYKSLLNLYLHIKTCADTNQPVQ